MAKGNIIDLTGQRFGRLIAVEYGYDQGKVLKWLCKCDCGNIKIVPTSYLRSGDTKSCGCYNKEGSSKKSFKHGGHGSTEYKTWRTMIDRCTNENVLQYKYYGARGIKICERWFDFANFIEDMGKKPDMSYSIDRIDVNGNYEPSNCKWATKTEQAINQRMKKNNKSGHTGVFKYNSTKWVSYITVNKKRIGLGYFEVIEDAVKARKEAELKYWG